MTTILPTTVLPLSSTFFPFLFHFRSSHFVLSFSSVLSYLSLFYSSISQIPEFLCMRCTSSSPIKFNECSSIVIGVVSYIIYQHVGESAHAILDLSFFFLFSLVTLWPGNFLLGFLMLVTVDVLYGDGNWVMDILCLSGWVLCSFSCAGLIWLAFKLSAVDYVTSLCHSQLWVATATPTKLIAQFVPGLRLVQLEGLAFCYLDLFWVLSCNLVYFLVCKSAC